MSRSNQKPDIGVVCYHYPLLGFTVDIRVVEFQTNVTNQKERVGRLYSRRVRNPTQVVIQKSIL